MRRMSSRRLLLLSATLAWVAACPRSDAALGADRQAPDAGVEPVLASLRADVRVLSDEARAWSRAVDERLWQHWVSGSPLNLDELAPRRDALLAPANLETLRAAMAKDADDARALEHLALFLEAEAAARAASVEAGAVAALESTLTFPFEGKEVRFTELTRLLANEKSALKRRALWAASLPAAAQLDAALAARDAKLGAALAPRSLLAFAAEQRDFDPEAMRRAAEGVLLLTSEAWRLTLERLNQADTRLPVASLTRADLPRLMRVPAEVELAFPKKELARRAVATLGAVGLYGQAGLTLELSEAAKKNPLPLTVMPGGPADVRVSFRPLGGLRDQQLLFGELGVALALQHVTAGRFEFERLGDTSLAQASGELFATLPGEAGWLEEQGVPEPLRRAIVDAWQAQRLFLVRRAAASYLIRLDAADLDDPAAKLRALAILTRALGVAHAEADLSRLRVDADDGLRAATTLRAMLGGELLRQRLSPDGGAVWFRSASTGPQLAELWSAGSSVPFEARVGPLGEALTAFWRRTIEVTPVGQPADGGGTFGSFGAPLGPVEAPFSTARPWPRARITYDGGLPGADAGTRWLPRPWPQRRVLLVEDAGVSPSP